MENDFRVHTYLFWMKECLEIGGDLIYNCRYLYNYNKLIICCFALLWFIIFPISLVIEFFSKLVYYVNF